MTAMEGESRITLMDRPEDAGNSMSTAYLNAYPKTRC
jgi:hypothetical protein